MVACSLNIAHSPVPQLSSSLRQTGKISAKKKGYFSGIRSCGIFESAGKDHALSSHISVKALSVQFLM